MKRRYFLLIAFVLMGCAPSQREMGQKVAKYEDLMAQRSEVVDDMNSCAPEPGCITSDRYQYDLGSLARLSNAASSVNPYIGN
jgi:hypothetical protein